MSEDKIKAYIGQKVATLVESFIETNCVWNHQRDVSSMKDHYRWSVVGAHERLKKIGFVFLETPDKLRFYTENGYGVHTDCFVWEYPNRIVDITEPLHPSMATCSLMRDLFGYINQLMLNTNIISEYKRFLASIHREEQAKMDLNARYGLTTIPIHEEAARVVADAIKAAGDSLLCQSWHRYPGQEDDINCILNGPRNINKEENIMIISGIKNVFFNEVKKTTTVVFLDHTSVIVKCTDNDHFDPEMGLAMAIARRCFGSRTKLKKAVDKWVATSAPKNEQLRKKAARKAEKEAAKVEHFKAQTESYME